MHFWAPPHTHTTCFSCWMLFAFIHSVACAGSHNEFFKLIQIVILPNYVWEQAGVRICKWISQCACFNTECTLFSMAIGQNKGVDSFDAVEPHLDLQYGKILFFFLLYISMKSTINMSAVPQCVYFNHTSILTLYSKRYCHCLDHFYSSTQSFLKKTGSWKKPWFKPKSWKKPVFIGFFQDFGFFTFPALEASARQEC